MNLEKINDFFKNQISCIELLSENAELVCKFCIELMVEMGHEEERWKSYYLSNLEGIKKDLKGLIDYLELIESSIVNEELTRLRVESMTNEIVWDLVHKATLLGSFSLHVKEIFEVYFQKNNPDMYKELYEKVKENNKLDSSFSELIEIAKENFAIIIDEMPKEEEV